MDPESCLNEKVNAFLFINENNLILGTMEGSVYIINVNDNSLNTLLIKDKRLRAITHMAYH